MSLAYPQLTRLGPLPGALAAAAGARCVVAYTVDFDGTGNEVGKGLEPFGMHPAGRYSARRGVPRHLDMLERLGIPATFFVPGYDAQCSPESVRSIHAAGHEIAAHGYVHEGTLFEPRRNAPPAPDPPHPVRPDRPGAARLALAFGPENRRDPPVLHELGCRYDGSDRTPTIPTCSTWAGAEPWSRSRTIPTASTTSPFSTFP